MLSRQGDRLFLDTWMMLKIMKDNCGNSFSLKLSNYENVLCKSSSLSHEDIFTKRSTIDLEAGSLIREFTCANRKSDKQNLNKIYKRIRNNLIKYVYELCYDYKLANEEITIIYNKFEEDFIKFW